MSEQTKPEAFATTVAVGLVPHRRDGIISLHVGNTVTLLDPNEADLVARQLNDYAQMGRDVSSPHVEGQTTLFRRARLGHNRAPILWSVEDERSGNERRCMGWGFGSGMTQAHFDAFKRADRRKSQRRKA